MIDSKKSAPSASNSKFTRSEAIKKSFNPSGVVPRAVKQRSQRYLYGGMLFPSHIISERETRSLERGAK